MAITLDGTLGITSPLETVVGQFSSASTMGFKNRIINGAMVIDQRNAGASVTPAITATTFNIDRWGGYNTQTSKYTIQQNAGGVTPPVGFNYYLGVTSTSAYTPISSDQFQLTQVIEGYNFADLGFGSANASSFTLSFWVRSSLTGTFGGVFRNSGTPSYRSYPFIYTINSANTWEYKTITVTGDTSTPWVGATNGTGIQITFTLCTGSGFIGGTTNIWGSGNILSATTLVNILGTSGATFYITGVQLEKGSTATSFDYRPYGTELALCQRYYYKQQAVSASSMFGTGFVNGTTTAVVFSNFPVPMRTSPTALEQSGTAANYQVYFAGASNVVCNAVPSLNTGDIWGATYVFFVASGLTTGQSCIGRAASSNAYLGWSAEL